MALAAARQVVKPVLGAVNIAGDLGVPYIGGAASLLQGIQDSCEKVVVHREECRQLSKRAQEMLTLFEEQNHKISESDLRIYVDEMENVLMGINRRMQRWARLGRFSAFLQDSKISQQIKASRLEIETQMNKFNFNSLMTIHDDGARTRALVEQQSVTIAELLHLVATRPSEGLDRIQRMEQDGEHIAGHVMEQGQQVLRQLREQDPTPQPQYQRRGTNSSQSSRITFMPQDPPERSQEYNELQHALGELYKRLRVLPQVQNLNGEVTRMGDIPVSGGTYSDVWIGEWMGEQKVALKALREVRTTANKAVKRFEREVKVWAGLDHPNILRFLGIVTNIGNFLQIVSPWQDNGNILDFVTKNPVTADRTHLLAGASKGLAYLHERKVVHGNLKCSNILVSEDQEALICDFGMAKVVEDVTEQSASATLTKAGSARWLAPEVIEGEVEFPNHASDVYSFAMTMYECLSGGMPFPTLRRDAQVIHKIIQEGQRPPRPVEGENGENANNAVWCTDEVWDVLESSWLRVPAERLTMDEVSERLGHIDDERRDRMDSSGEATPRVASPVPMDVDEPEVSPSA